MGTTWQWLQRECISHNWYRESIHLYSLTSSHWLSSGQFSLKNGGKKKRKLARKLEKEMATVRIASLHLPASLPPRVSPLNSSARGLRFDHSSVQNVASSAKLRYSSHVILCAQCMCVRVLEEGVGMEGIDNYSKFIFWKWYRGDTSVGIRRREALFQVLLSGASFASLFLAQEASADTGIYTSLFATWYDDALFFFFLFFSIQYSWVVKFVYWYII